jgi:predicted ATP-dependent serine protease
MSFYTEYYQNVIQHQQGFKLVLGGTGLGKTSGIIETVKQNTEKNKRFFYMANRLQLLNELKTDLEKANIGYCLQKRDEEIISEIEKNDFDNLIENPIIDKYAKSLEKVTKTSKNSIKQTFNFVKDNTTLANNDESKDFLREKVTKIFSFLRNIIKQAGKEKNRKDYETLISNSTIKILFPYFATVHKKFLRT